MRGLRINGHSLLENCWIIFVDKVIPHEKTIIFPTEAPITAPTLPTFQKAGTISRLASEKEQMTVDEND